MDRIARIAPFSESVTLHVQIPSSQSGEAIEAIDEEVAFRLYGVGAAIPGAIFVRFRGIVHYLNVRAGVVSEFQHNFGAFDIDDMYTLFNQIIQWGESFHLLHSSDEPIIEEIEIEFIYPNAGGCNGGNRKTIVKTGGFIYESFPGEDMNCFFRAARNVFVPPLSKVSSASVRTLRHMKGIMHDGPISIEEALRFGKDKISIYEEATKQVHGEGDIVLMLKDGHYFLRKGEYYSKKCDHCHKVYFRTHRCRSEVFPFCGACGYHHDDDTDCNASRASYYQSMVCGKPKLIGFKKKENKEVEEDAEDIIVHYDIETFVGENNVHTPYVVGYVVEDEMLALTGDDCMEQFVDVLMELGVQAEDSKARVYVDAFNGSRFDHYYLIKAVLKKGIKVEHFKVTSGSIVCASFGGCFLFDMAKHTLGSLRQNLKEYGCNVQKGDFDHSQACRWEEMSPILRKECLKYLEGDVMGLKEMYDTLNGGLEEEYGRSIHRFISTGHLSYSIWVEDYSSSFGIYRPSPEQEDAFRQSVFGGRCYKTTHSYCSSQYDDVLERKINFDEIEDFMVDLDVVSLYPTAMSCFEYPYGPCYEMGKDENCFDCDGNVKHIGIYLIEYSAPHDIQHAVLPRREKGKLKWDLKDGRGWYTSVDIENALKVGYKVQVLRGWYWKKKAYIFKEYIMHLFEAKKMSQKGSVKYALSKLFMNSIYGKLIQRPRFEDNAWVQVISDFYKFYDSHFVTEFEYIGDQLYVGGVPKENQGLAITKPSFLGSLVLAYSRRIMLKYMNDCNPFFKHRDEKLRMENDFLYTDTDSLHVRSKNVCVQSSELGGITDDLGEKGCKIIRAIYVAPKLYMLEYVKKGEDELFYHFRGKGVDLKSLNVEMFETMLHQGIVSTSRDFRMKKICLKRNSKQLNIECLSIVHETWEKTVRELNKIPWNEREFVEGYGSIPFK